ncbi:cell division protein ZapE [archaeon]|nr:MAG: cell division protein ZapE [archaeon]
MLCYVIRIRCSIAPRMGLNNVARRVHSTLIERYDEKCKLGELQDDPYQRRLIKLMDKLKNAAEVFPFERFQSAQNIVSSGDTVSEEAKNFANIPRLRGLYMYGSVGVGKTMLMDLFFNTCHVKQKRRVHFHQFMLDVHRRMHEHKQSLLHAVGKERHIQTDAAHDSIAIVAKAIAQEAHLLCFDEFQVTDICDAVILTKLFGTLWSCGTVVFATSNRAPSELYLNGLNRHDFLPFIDRIEKECIVRDINSIIDYRMQKTSKLSSFTPNSPGNLAHLWNLYTSQLAEINDNNTINVTEVRPYSLPIGTRTMSLDSACVSASMCMVAFATLCEEDRGAVDYYTLASNFHTVYLYGVPFLSKVNHNVARRFITLIDELYNNHVRLIWVGAAPPLELFRSEKVVHDYRAEAENKKVLEKGAGLDKKYSRSGQQSK